MAHAKTLKTQQLCQELGCQIGPNVLTGVLTKGDERMDSTSQHVADGRLPEFRDKWRMAWKGTSDGDLNATDRARMSNLLKEENRTYLPAALRQELEDAYKEYWHPECCASAGRPPRGRVRFVIWRLQHYLKLKLTREEREALASGQRK